MRLSVAGIGLGVLAVVITLHGAAKHEAAESRYDFRDSPAYAALSAEDRARIEQVHHDFVLLWGALDLYAQDHDGQAPPTLEDLTPLYLRELPHDPFATDATAAETEIGQDKTSPSGRGYRYRPGRGTAWIIASVGLPEFPYSAERDNVGLYIANGTWISGRQIQPVQE